MPLKSKAILMEFSTPGRIYVWFHDPATMSLVKVSPVLVEKKAG
jgi:hypothetical protein